MYVMIQYLGFKNIFEHRNAPCQLKDKNILEEMKKTQVDPLTTPYLR